MPTSSSRPTRCLIHLDHIRHNFLYARSLAPDAKTLAVVKADAYGHGAIEVSKTLSPHTEAFAVARLHEAVELREAGIDHPILLLEGAVSMEETKEALARNFWITIAGPEQLQWFQKAPSSPATVIWLKFDSGMHRLGWNQTGLRKAYRALTNHPGVSERILMTHFARADEWQADATQEQILRHKEATKNMQTTHSLCNSAGIMAWPQAHGDWIRPGIMMYGANPLSADRLGKIPTHDLKPTMTLESKLIAIRTLKAGESIGYGGRYITNKPTPMGVVALGYADGYPRSAKDGTPVSVDGHPAHIIGRVSMDMVTVDLSQAPDSQVGSRVELWGSEVDANNVANHCGTIAYELFTRISKRCEKIHID